MKCLTPSGDALVPNALRRELNSIIFALTDSVKQIHHKQT